MIQNFHHQPVLLRETLHYLAPRDGGRYVDATVGGGGHAEAILEANAPEGMVLAIDRDPDAIEYARHRLARFGERVRIVQGRFGQLPQILESSGFGDPAGRVDGLLVDVGVSSYQLEVPKRGFSFQSDGPLDMRMSQEGPTAAELIDGSDLPELTRILAEYGEVREPRRIARAMLDERTAGRLDTTRQLADLVSRVARPVRRGHIHPATRVFQALRIAVNRELEELEAVCGAVPDLLVEGGVGVFISFHSLEDRVVKQTLKGFASRARPPRGVPIPEGELAAPSLKLLTRRPVEPSEGEKIANPRSRSARLRAVRRLAIEET